ncbi:class C sortase [Corynebacterium sp. HMSC05E07]|uniref:class C sortase n=1 Tax=Corynebacterium sp. HMSC05E07 TaxID=1581117 RepID=UPI0008A4DD56|nr:class C sortase [Corynebacterium sp. HMSC05E07]OFT60409.1 class C sortase [Corynebacterium sp. HMSC05E07]
MTEQIAKPRKTENQSTFKRVFLPILLVIVGLLVMLYPVYATQWNNVQQQKVAALYEQDVKEMTPEEKSQAVEEARRYNDEHGDAPILDPWLARVSEDNVAYQEYLKQLSGSSAMSQVVIPSIDSKLPVYHGTDDKTLQKGLGHLFGSALPVGGEGHHSVITGHTGLSNATLWDNLVDVEEGDAIYISTFGEQLKYEVHDIEVVLPEETDSLQPKEGEDLLTLITCTPYGINTHRLLVHAHRVPMDAEESHVFEDKASFMQWWMWLLIALALVIIAAMVWWLRNLRKASVGETSESNESEAEAGSAYPVSKDED